MDKKKNKLEEFLKLMDIDAENVTKDEFVEMFGLLIDFVGKIKEENDTHIDSLSAESKKNIEDALDNLKSFNKTELEELRNFVNLRKDKYTLTDADKREIARQIDVPTVEKIIQTIETIKTEVLKETPEEIRNKLETLKDEERLDASAIKGLGKRLSKFGDDLLNRAIGILDQRTSFLINKVSNLSDRINNLSTTGGGHTIQDEGTPLTQRTNLNFKGAGVTVTDDLANNATIVTVSTSAGAGYQQPTSGAIDGSNTVFAFATAPNAIVVDGVSLQKVAADTTVNWTGTTTITLSVAPNFDIYGVA